MKKFLIIAIIVALFIGGWFGYKEIRRSSLLSSGERLLLVKDDKSAYAYSEDILLDNIDRSWDIIGKVSSLSAEKIAKTIEGIDLYQELTTATLVKDLEVQIPQGEEVEAWQQVLATITPAQKEHCESIQSLDYAQFCIATHFISTIIQTNEAVDSCNQLFIENYRTDCVNAVTSQEPVSYPDTNANSIIDFFEQYNRSESESASFSETPGVIN